jgi:hypothetical protein
MALTTETFVAEISENKPAAPLILARRLPTRDY